MTAYLLPNTDTATPEGPAAPILALPSGSGAPDFGVWAPGTLIGEPAEHVARRLAELAVGLPVGGRRVVMWSGGTGEGLFDASPATWAQEAHRALDETCEAAAAAMEGVGGTLILRPHARHVLADTQTCLTFLRRWEGRPIGLALDAVAMLEPSMVGHAEDHLARAFEALGPLCVAVVMAGGLVDAELGRVVSAGLCASEVDGAMIAGLARRFCRAGAAALVVDAADAAAVVG